MIAFLDCFTWMVGRMDTTDGMDGALCMITAGHDRTRRFKDTPANGRLALFGLPLSQSTRDE
jgi:hypothetical protein